jgi:hypothetical protein
LHFDYFGLNKYVAGQAQVASNQLSENPHFLITAVIYFSRNHEKQALDI